MTNGVPLQVARHHKQFLESEHYENYMASLEAPQRQRRKSIRNRDDKEKEKGKEQNGQAGSVESLGGLDLDSANFTPVEFGAGSTPAPKSVPVTPSHGTWTFLSDECGLTVSFHSHTVHHS
jgi:hypothetical protein